MVHNVRPQHQGGPAGRPPLDGPQAQSIPKFKAALAEAKTFSDDRVMSLAAELAADFARGFKREKKETGKTQVRKVYGEIRGLKEKGKGGFEAIRPEIRLIQAHVAYAVGRDALPISFKEFADEAVTHLLKKGGAEELDRFVKFFEAMYAQFYFFTSKHGQREG